MSGAALRNEKIVNLLDEQIRAVKTAGTTSALPLDVEAKVRLLFTTTSFGLREIVLTCIAAWDYGIKFNLTDTDFYECQPRAVFEQGVRAALDRHKLPRMKSGPLNRANLGGTALPIWRN